jgi:hypothetical protein
MQTYYLEATVCSLQRPCDPVELSKFGHSAKTKINKRRRKKELSLTIYIQLVKSEINERKARANLGAEYSNGVVGAKGHQITGAP